MLAFELTGRGALAASQPDCGQAWRAWGMSAASRGRGVTDMPTKLQEWRHRYTALALLVLIIIVPLVLFFATLPGDGAGGFIDIGGVGWRIILLVAAGVIFVILGVLLGTCASIRADHELLFGAMTVFMVLTTAAVFASAFARRHVENYAALTFVLAALSIATLILIAHDWARRQLLITAVIAAAALGLFFVRIGHESLSVPPRWERAQIAAQAKVQERAPEAQHAAARPSLLAAARTARTRLGGILGRATPPSVDHALLGQARIILYDANTSLTTISPQAFARFDVSMANEPVTFPPAATTELTDAVHALQAAGVAAATQIDHSPLDQAICAVTGNSIRQSTGACVTGGPDEITSNRAWVTAKHDLDVELAAYRSAVTGTAADEAALRKVLAQPAGTDADVTVLAAMENGPETLWGSVFRAPVPPLVPGPLGWVILAALLLGLLRWLLMVNASQLAGPVEIVPGKNDDQLVAVLRVAVPAERRGARRGTRGSQRQPGDDVAQHRERVAGPRHQDRSSRADRCRSTIRLSGQHGRDQECRSDLWDRAGSCGDGDGGHRDRGILGRNRNGAGPRHLDFRRAHPGLAPLHGPGRRSCSSGGRPVGGRRHPEPEQPHPELGGVERGHGVRAGPGERRDPLHHP